MHRSGTSLTANWLAQCGLDVGDQLVPADWSNPAGHYEDITFSHLQRDILQANGTDHLVVSDRAFTVNGDQRARALRLIESRRDRPQWGWKDPRTTLLLDFWQSLLPDIKILGVYRHYAQVTDSLMRRDRGKQKKRLQRAGARLRYSMLNVPLARRYLRVWDRYNHDLLTFAAANPDHCLIVHVDDVVSHTAEMITYLNGAWGFALRPVEGERVYDPALLKTARMPLQQGLAALYGPACAPTLRALEQQRTGALRRIGVG